MPLSPGKQLGRLEVIRPIGRGAMGEVYEALDTSLDRKIAVKVLPPELVSPTRLSRFEREAKALAALSHPNILHVYSVEEVDGVRFITTELVRGSNLSEQIPKGGTSLEQLLEIGSAMADALAVAHDKGIVHRDLKPGNVMVDADGQVKVLDFGLAKLVGDAAEKAASEAPTATQEGQIVGTVAYMSPEQAEGKALDGRSDVFSLGIILYEMATGERPFRGDTPTTILSSILKDTPPVVTKLRPSLPEDLAKIIRKALAKDPERRYQTAKDVRNDLEDLKLEAKSSTRPSRTPWIFAAVGLTVAVARDRCAPRTRRFGVRYGGAD